MFLLRLSCNFVVDDFTDLFKSRQSLLANLGDTDDDHDNDDDTTDLGESDHDHSKLSVNVEHDDAGAAGDVAAHVALHLPPDAEQRLLALALHQGQSLQHLLVISQVFNKRFHLILDAAVAVFLQLQTFLTMKNSMIKDKIWVDLPDHKHI